MSTAGFLLSALDHKVEAHSWLAKVLRQFLFSTLIESITVSKESSHFRFNTDVIFIPSLCVPLSIFLLSLSH